MIHSYPWYVGDWRASETRLDLSLEERGLYRELLDFCYLERSLPTDERKLARIVNCSDEEFQRCWAQVKPLFNELNGRYHHRKVDEVLGRLDGYTEQRRQAGIASGERRRTSVPSPVEISLPKKATKNEPSHPIPSLPTEEIVVEGKNTHTNARAPIAADLNGHTSQRFEEFWQRWPRKQHRDQACRLWISVVSVEDESAVFGCLDRFLASEQAGRSVIPNPENWLMEQSRDRWQGDWPIRAAPQRESRSAMLDKALEGL